MDFSGVTTALITPFKNGELDKDSFFNLLTQQVDSGIKSFVINGTTGESPTLTTKEVENLCLWFREFEKTKGHKLQLILGTGTFSTQTTIEKTKKAKDLTADAVLVVVPYYNKPPQSGLLAHFQSVARSTTLPVILYNVPSRTSSSLSLDTITSLSKVKNIIGIKESTGDMEFLKQIKQNCGDDFLFLSGDDFTAVNSFLSGGDGVVAVCSHVLAKPLIAAYEKALKKDQTALDDFKKYDQFLTELYKQANPIGIKVLLKELGIISSSELRLPLKEPSQWSLKEFLK